ncbi:ribosomal-protein-alanine N-acetyltransferase [Angulomicrobium tetraedrale]|uniref:Ribosomal-protein-alanine N-acetyltransferase n=1 Tax=Ancylobacter tetraedralis TaxID=217068 RepID=A0A839Z1X9_9HYPH|nr:ribosomal protein S18-alanine N-acetyltransferase [Ancylobacter tetraedralis]MBB3770724.1 ribosomal-protein-alanine N-acetyltransferase [Ancylobacter tetraedralis]
MTSRLFELLGITRPDTALRTACTADADALAQIHSQSFRIGWDASEFERLLANRLSRCLVATEGPTGRILGFILLSGVSPEMEILSVAVAPSRRGEGIARRLVVAAFAELAAQGFRTVFLEVEEGNAPALRLYQHTGFQEIGRRSGYYRSAAGEPAAALVMRRDIA